MYNQRRAEQRPAVSNATRRLLKTALAADVQLYEFALQRLHRQARAVGVDGESQSALSGYVVQRLSAVEAAQEHFQRGNESVPEKELPAR